MNMHTISDAVKFVQGVASQAKLASGTVVGGWVDCFGYENAACVFNVGAIVDAVNKSLTLSVLEDDTGPAGAGGASGHTIVEATTDILLAAQQNGLFILEFNLSERKRFLKALITAGSADGGYADCIWLLWNGRYAPPVQQSAVVKVLN
jgi:hypothetical protein